MKMLQTRELSCRSGALLLFLGFMPLCGSAVVPAGASQVSKFETSIWNALFQEIYPGKQFAWASRQEFAAWLQKEREKLEPIVLEWLGQEPGSASWKRAMYVAEKMPTKRIRDVVLMHMMGTVARLEAEGKSLRDSDPATFAGAISILAAGRDARAVAYLNELIQSKRCSSHLADKYLKALRDIGDASSLGAVRRMPLGKTNERIGRKARLTEKIIDARLRGTNVAPDAQKELRAFARRFIRAAETQNYESYIACLPFGAQAVVDEGDMKEFLEHPDGRPALAALSQTLGGRQPFDVDLDNLHATLTCGDGFQFECVLEVDGWKVANLKRIVPRRAHPGE